MAAIPNGYAGMTPEQRRRWDEAVRMGVEQQALYMLFGQAGAFPFGTTNTSRPAEPTFRWKAVYGFDGRPVTPDGRADIDLTKGADGIYRMPGGTR